MAAKHFIVVAALVVVAAAAVAGWWNERRVLAEGGRFWSDIASDALGRSCGGICMALVAIVLALEPWSTGHFDRWLAVAFILGGAAWLLRGGFRSMQEWWRYGNRVLHLNPLRWGHELSGWLSMPSGSTFQTRVSICLIYEHGNTCEGVDGTDVDWSEVWRTGSTATFEPSLGGARATFAMPVPAELPRPEEESQERWQIIVEATGFRDRYALTMDG